MHFAVPIVHRVDVPMAVHVVMNRITLTLVHYVKVMTVGVKNVVNVS